jgi:AcrR family transcriptional regulator
MPAQRDWANAVMSTVVGKEVPETARTILRAAQRVLARDGYEALTIRSIAEEALTTRSLVLYHFGTVSNIEALLVDSLWHDYDAGFVQSLNQSPADTNSRIDALTDFYARIAADLKLWRMYYTLVPSVVSKRRVQDNLAHIYRSYRRDIDHRCLQDIGLDPHRINGLSGLFLAVGEGLPLQQLVGPEERSQDDAFALFGGLVKQHVRQEDSASSRPATYLRAATESTEWMPRRNPAQDLPKPAQRILKASRRLMERRGLKAVTLDGIAAISGEPRSSVSYYFQGKQGLLDALFESVLCDCQSAFVALFSSETLPSATEFTQALFRRRRPLRALFLMLPAVLYDQRLFEDVGGFHRDLHQWLAVRIPTNGGANSENLNLSRVLVAALYGITIQTVYDPADFDPRPGLDTVSGLVALGGQSHKS